jgi:Protein of unknown function (DUF3987)
MTQREHHDWLSAFVEYTKHGEAPTKMYFWTGVTTIAGALRRRIWFDQAHFKWYPNLYTIIVAPPGVVSKSTTADLGMDLLRLCPGINFGPDVVTWQALFDAFCDVHEGIPFNGETLEMSPLTIAASELGNFLRPDDSWMVDQLVNIWDGKPVKKRTRMDGEQVIQNPCLNLIGCTTPSWIAQNFPDYMIGGGLTSRMLFVYAEAKQAYVAYPFRHVPEDFLQRKAALVRDLEKISNLLGPVSITPDAVTWGEEWYERWFKIEAKNIDETMLGGYINRKQTLVHKLAMILVASKGDELVIRVEDLQRAVALISDLEAEMPKVYSRIGMNPLAVAADKAVSFVARAGGRVPFVALYGYMHKAFPSNKEFEDILAGLVFSGKLRLITDANSGGKFFEIPT